MSEPTTGRYLVARSAGPGGPLSEAVAALICEHVDATVLAQLAGARRLVEIQGGPQARLSRESAEELCSILAGLEKPTLGWWKWHLHGRGPEIHYRARTFRMYASPEARYRRSAARAAA